MSGSTPPPGAAPRESRITRPDLAAPLRFTVRIFYCEPTYAEHRGIDATTYSVAYVVTAFDASGAEVLARRRFAEACLAGSVGWVREVVRVECAADDATAR